MLAKIAPASRDFKTLSDYLVRGKGQTSDQRVAWMMSRNLPTEDPDLVAKLMQATARLSVRVRNPVYHVMIAWAPHEKPVPEMMQTIAAQALELTGLGEHQAFVIGHGDTSHPHLHMMVNRIHPETGKAWKPTHDFRLFDRVMRQLAEAHGFTHAPSHVFNPDETDALAKGPPTEARHAAKRGAATTRQQWSRRNARQISRRVSEHLDLTSTVQDLIGVLGKFGLRVETKGRGHVVGNDEGYVKASSLRFDVDARCLKLAPGQGTKLQLVDGVDIVRALRTWGLADDDDLRSAIEDAQAERLRNTSDRH